MGTERYIDALLEEDIISAAETLRSENYDGKTVFVTGATGLIGSQLVRTLLRLNESGTEVSGDLAGGRARGTDRPDAGAGPDRGPHRRQRADHPAPHGGLRRRDPAVASRLPGPWPVDRGTRVEDDR